MCVRVRGAGLGGEGGEGCVSMDVYKKHRSSVTLCDGFTSTHENNNNKRHRYWRMRMFKCDGCI